MTLSIMDEILYQLAYSIPGFLLAVIIHEYAHGYMALRFGDSTAERAGRLTFNPAVHLDPMGTVVFPIICLALGGAVFGWARPVPVVPRNFKDIKRGIFWVSFAGPLANFLLGVLSALLLVLLHKFGGLGGYSTVFATMLQFSILINFILGGFNLIPLPPLDGSRMVATFLNGEALRKYESIAQYTPMIFLGVIGLSMVGIHTFGYLLMPFVWFAQKLPIYISYLIG